MHHQPYSQAFYEAQKTGSLRSARIVVPTVLDVLAALPVDSICDVGCGVGTWLRVFLELGVPLVRGYDGPHVAHEQLMVETECFAAADLSAHLPETRRFSLAISLEVAEHIPACQADVFVDNLTRLAPTILFSACTPTPGHGTGHVNEQTQSYWAAKMATKGYWPSTVIRDRIWGCHDVEWFYRQNSVLYLKADVASRLGIPVVDRSQFHLLDVRHPDFVSLIMAESINLQSPARLLICGSRRLLGNVLHRLR